MPLPLSDAEATGMMIDMDQLRDKMQRERQYANSYGSLYKRDPSNPEFSEAIKDAANEYGIAKKALTDKEKYAKAVNDMAEKKILYAMRNESVPHYPTNSMLMDLSDKHGGIPLPADVGIGQPSKSRFGFGRGLGGAVGPLLKGLGIGATALTAAGIGQKAMAGDLAGAAKDAVDVGTDYIPYVSEAKMAISSPELGNDLDSRAYEDPTSDAFKSRIDALKKIKAK